MLFKKLNKESSIINFKEGRWANKNFDEKTMTEMTNYYKY